MDRPGSGRSGRQVVVAVVLGAALGFAVGAGVYLVINPVLETSGGWIETFQGLVWNLVPLGAVIGALTGYLVARRR
jgi:hypothetical protein